MLVVNSYSDWLGLSLSIPHELRSRELFINSILDTAVSTCERLMPYRPYNRCQVDARVGRAEGTGGRGRGDEARVRVGGRVRVRVRVKVRVRVRVGVRVGLEIGLELKLGLELGLG